MASFWNRCRIGAEFPEFDEIHEVMTNLSEEVKDYMKMKDLQHVAQGSIWNHDLNQIDFHEILSKPKSTVQAMHADYYDGSGQIKDCRDVFDFFQDFFCFFIFFYVFLRIYF
jgi:uncharacterized protein (UPF0264 family)